MSAVALLNPASLTAHRWVSSGENASAGTWNEQNSSGSDSDMPESNSQRQAKSKRSQSKEKKQIEDKQRRSPEFDPTSIKVERGSRDGISVPCHSNSTTEGGSPRNPTPSPSSSPKSPAGAQPRAPSSFSGTSPQPAFTPPKTITPACFSPVGMGGLGAISGLAGGLGPMGIFNGAAADGRNGIPRNCSDLMRSMAAKYNNNNNTSAGYYNNPLNGFHRPPISPVGFPHSAVTPTQSHDNNNSNLPQPSSVKVSEPQKRPNTAVIPTGLPPHLLPAGAFPGLPPSPLMDLSSTQVLINMVRNASNLQNHITKAPTDLHNQQQLQKHLLYQQQLQQHQQQHQQQLNNKLSPKSSPTDSDNQSLDLKASETTHRTGLKRFADSSSPLDLSSVPNKHPRTMSDTDINIEDDEIPNQSPDTPSSPSRIKVEGYSTPTSSKNRFEDKENTQQWTVDDVYDFVRSIDICAEYAESFREQKIDGASLMLLSETHLTESLKMKLGPALKLRSFLAVRNQQHPNHPLLSPQTSCNHCSNNNNNNNNTIGKRYHFVDSPSSELLSPGSRAPMLSPSSSHGTKCFSPPPHIENGSPQTTENRIMSRCESAVVVTSP